MSPNTNHLNKINSLIALRQHYFAMFQLEADFIERHRGMPSAVKSAGESAATIADRLRVIDTKLAGHYEQLIRGARAKNPFKPKRARGLLCVIGTSC